MGEFVGDHSLAGGGTWIVLTLGEVQVASHRHRFRTERSGSLTGIGVDAYAGERAPERGLHLGTDG